MTTCFKKQTGYLFNNLMIKLVENKINGVQLKFREYVLKSVYPLLELTDGISTLYRFLRRLKYFSSMAKWERGERSKAEEKVDCFWLGSVMIFYSCFKLWSTIALLLNAWEEESGEGMWHRVNCSKKQKMN